MMPAPSSEDNKKKSSAKSNSDPPFSEPGRTFERPAARRGYKDEYEDFDPGDEVNAEIGNPDTTGDPNLLAEISEDPVRLYLKEIGNIELLEPDQEFWLATMIEASRRIDALKRLHPLARGQPGPPGIQPDGAAGIYAALYEELKTSWKRLVEDTTRLEHDAQIWVRYWRKPRIYA